MLQTPVPRMKLLLVLAVPLWKCGFLLLFLLHFYTVLSSLNALVWVLADGIVERLFK